MSPPLKPDTDAWKAEVLSKIDPHRTAVLAIDLQTDFCSSDGALAALGSDITPCTGTAERIARFLPQVRGLVDTIAFFQLIYDVDEMSASQQERLLRDGKPFLCVPETPGSRLVINPAPGDLVFTKHRYSAFTNASFLQLLHDRSINTVVVTGVDTHICIEGTVRHGYDLGFRMVVLSDLVGTRKSELGRHETSLQLCERYFSVLVTSRIFLAALNQPRHACEWRLQSVAESE